MKKVLLASTALLFTAGYASAAGHISMSMDGAAGITYDSSADAETGQINPKFELDINFNATGTTDAGLEFGAKLTVDENTAEGGQPDDIELFISGTFGTVTMGMVDPAVDGFGISDIGLFGVGVDDLAEQYKNATAGADVVYEYGISGLTFIASAEFGDANSVAASLEYDAGAFSAGIGYTDDANVDNAAGVGSNSTITLVAGFSQGPVSVSGIYSDWDGGTAPSGQGYGIDVSFDTGAATITAAYTNASGTSAGDPLGSAYGIGFAVPLGGGLAVEGGVGIIDEDGEDSVTKADLGVSMSF